MRVEFCFCWLNGYQKIRHWTSDVIGRSVGDDRDAHGRFVRVRHRHECTWHEVEEDTQRFQALSSCSRVEVVDGPLFPISRCSSIAHPLCSRTSKSNDPQDVQRTTICMTDTSSTPLDLSQNRTFLISQSHGRGGAMVAKPDPFKAALGLLHQRTQRNVHRNRSRQP